MCRVGYAGDFVQPQVRQTTCRRTLAVSIYVADVVARSRFAAFVTGGISIALAIAAARPGVRCCVGRGLNINGAPKVPGPMPTAKMRIAHAKKQK
jgi:hypothetical protein